MQFYGLHLTKPKVAEVELGDRKGDRWRQKSKQLKFFFMRSEERTRNEASAEGRESPSVGEATPSTRQPTRYKVQIIDVNTQTDGIRPYSLYVLLVRSEGGEAKSVSQCIHTMESCIVALCPNCEIGEELLRNKCSPNHTRVCYVHSCYLCWEQRPIYLSMSNIMVYHVI